MAKEMLFSVVCPTCEAKIGVHDKRLINQLVQCPKCGSIVQLSPPEGFTQGVDLPKIEEKQEKITPPPVVSTPQPIPDKRDKNEITPPKSSSVPQAPPVPIPPPAPNPVPPPVSIPEPIAPESLMPEPMSPGGFNSKSAMGGKSLSQQIGALSEKMPAWMPYVVIGVGVIALITMLVIFISAKSTKEMNNNQPTTENKESTDSSKNKDNENKDSAVNEKDKKETGNNTDINKENSGEALSSNEISVNEGDDAFEEDKNNNKDVTPENEKPEDSALSDDNLDNNPAEDNLPNSPVENDNNDFRAEPEEPESENNLETDNPFQDVEQNPVSEPDQATPSEDNPVENEGGEAIAEGDATPENDENPENIKLNPEENPSEDKESDPEMLKIPGLGVMLKSISIREQKLSQCLQMIRELGALPVEVNWDSLRRNGVNADDKISWSGENVTLKTVLTEVLAQRGLMFIINGEGKVVFVPRVSVNARSDMLVNSGENGSAMVKTQYSVSDLVGQSPEKTAALIKSIREFLCPGDWKEVGGTGTITASGGGSIMITQSQHNQWIIADFLDRLRLARRLAPLYNRDASLEPMFVRAQSALKRNVGINFQPSADLKTALSEIGQRIGVSILLDEPSLKIAGISAQFPISFDAREMSLEDAFNRINEETGLTYLAQTPNSFIVTTVQGAKSMMSVEFYPISDLVNIGLTPTVLMEQIVKFEPKSWKVQDAASFGLVDYDPSSDCLIVRQSQDVHSKIAQLLEQLRIRLKEK